MRKFAPFIILLALPAEVHAQSESFIVRMSKDTIARETFVRAANTLMGDVSGPAVQGRMRYAVTLSSGVAKSMEMDIFAVGADTPHIKVKAEFVADSVIAHVARGGGSPQMQRIPSRRGAVPFINLSFALIELVTAHEKRTVGDTLTSHFFILGNGATVPAQFTWNAADSAILSMGGMDLRLHLDARGRILHGALPGQNLFIERVAGTLERTTDAAPDYSAPANANYTTVDVTIRASAGHTLAGTLTLPKQRSGKIPAVVTLSGSGPQDRDEALGFMKGYRPFREIAEALARRGIATLRYDDRGMGASTGVYAEATTLDLAADANSVVAYLKKRPEINADKIFLIGHSEGAMIAPMLAAEDDDFAGIVLLAGPAHRGRRILEYQARLAADRVPGKTPAERDSIFRAGMQLMEAPGQPWINYFMTYDPLPYIWKVEVPVLIIHGATDRQVTADQAEMLAKELRAAGNVDVAVHVLPDVNHLFLSDPVGYGSGYTALPTRTVVPQMLQLLSDWIVNKSK